MQTESFLLSPSSLTLKCFQISGNYQITVQTALQCLDRFIQQPHLTKLEVISLNIFTTNEFLVFALQILKCI